METTNRVSVDKKNRFLNYFIDSFLLIFVSDWILMNLGVDYSNAEIKGLKFFLMPLYYFFFEYAFQTTLGKLITGTKVVCVDGSKPSAGQILKRSLIRIIPLDPWSYLGIFHTNHTNVGWHDTWTNTIVVKKDRYMSL